MPYARRRYAASRGRGRVARRKPFTARRTSKVPVRYRKAITSAVSKQIHLNAENKYAAYIQRPTQIKPVIGDIQAVNLFRVVPAIPKGTDVNERVGNKVTPRWLSIRGYVQLDMNGLDADYDRLQVRMILGFPKRYPLYPTAVQQITSAPGVNWTNILMDFGTGMSKFAGTLDSLQAPVNRGAFTVKAQKYIRLTRPRFYDAALVGSDSFRYSGNSVKFFHIKVKCPKTFVYESVANNDLYPTNFDPVLCVGYTLLNGQTPPAPDQTAPAPLTVSFTSRLHYEDA